MQPIYVGVSEAASMLATTASPAMQSFAGQFPATAAPHQLPLDKGQEAYRLAIALKKDLLRSWQHPFFSQRSATELMALDRCHRRADSPLAACRKTTEDLRRRDAGVATA